MHSRLTMIVAQQHIADLRRAADHHRLVQASHYRQPQRRPTAGRPVAAAPPSSPCERGLSKCSAARL
jgi:hypothetical protein